MNNSTKRLNLIINAQKYADHEIHDISFLLVCIRDGNDEIKEKCEKCLQAFITKKRLGEIVVFKKLRKEFGIP